MMHFILKKFNPGVIHHIDTLRMIEEEEGQ